MTAGTKLIVHSAPAATAANVASVAKRLDAWPAIGWGAFASEEPELASFGAGRLQAAPAYLATVRRDGRPRVHPVTPIVTDDGLFLFMEPTSPKGNDLRQRHWYGLHNGVADSSGTGGEFSVSGEGCAVDDLRIRESVAAAAAYDPAERYVLFELRVADTRCNGYGDVALPAHRRWSATPHGHEVADRA